MTDRQALKRWEEERNNIRKSTPVKYEEPDVKAERIERLQNNFVAFCKYYFPKYASAPFAKFQIEIANKIIKNDTIYAVAAFAREHGKSVLLGLFVPAYLMFTKRLFNMLLVSHNQDNAIELLKPLISNLESNQRLINDYGQQKGWRDWKEGKWITNDKVSFRSIGAGQSPRGTRDEEKRPDFILIDDIDTDEESRNQKRINNKWDWLEQALFPTMSISGSKRFVFAGNIIAKESTIVKASQKADYFKKVNILNSKGEPSWSRYTKKDVDYILSKVSYASAQKEYFNNPINEGTVFEDITWGKVPPLSRLKYIVAYCDPSYKNSKKNDFKAIPLVGELNGTFYVYTAYVQQTTVAKMIDWFYDLDAFVNEKTAIYNYIEAGSLQDTFYQELFLPKLITAGETKGKHLSISPDHRKKPDKFTRIEATLEPLNRQARLVFNERQKKNPHMMRLEEQMKAIEPSLPAHDDAPDALEGAVWIINNKLRTFAIKSGKRKRSNKRYWLMAFIVKADLRLSILEDELNEIVRNDDTLIAQAISAAESEMRAYLFDSYDVDTIFSTTGSDRHQLLVRHCVDIAVWGIVAATQAGQDLDDRKARYDRACKWLKMVQSMQNYADLPRRETTQQTHIIIGSNPRRKNYF